MPTLVSILIATTLSSLGGLVGGFILLWREDLTKRWMHVFLSFAAGGLLAAAFFDVLPESINGLGASRALLYALSGFLLFFFLEKVLHWHHSANEAHAGHRQVVPLIIIGDSIHNFTDGLVIAASYIVNPALGTVTAIAVWLHEIPQEIGDFTVLINAGLKRRRVAQYNFWSALVSPLGALIGYFAVKQVPALMFPLVALAAGNFLYLSGAYLIPELHKETRPKKNLEQMLTLLLAIVFLALITKALGI